MSNHIHGMTQKYNGTHYRPGILPIKPKAKPQPTRVLTSVLHVQARLQAQQNGR